MNNNNKLFDKNVLITAGAQGIGESITKHFIDSGANVAIHYFSSSDTANQLVEYATSKGQKAVAISGDLTNEDDAKKVVKKTLEAFGSLDILINNAAINPVFKGLESMSEEIYDKMMNVNLKAAFDLSNLCFPYLKDSKGSSIINIASVEGLKPSFGLGLYGVTKAALIMLTQVQAKEWGKYGIRSNAICPGLIQTKFSSALWQNETIMKQVVKELPAGRMAQPQELTGLAVYLASDAGSYSTGGIYTVDGGHMIV